MVKVFEFSVFEVVFSLVVDVEEIEVGVFFVESGHSGYYFFKSFTRCSVVIDTWLSLRDGVDGWCEGE